MRNILFVLLCISWLCGASTLPKGFTHTQWEYINDTDIGVRSDDNQTILGMYTYYDGYSKQAKANIVIHYVDFKPCLRTDDGKWFTWVRVDGKAFRFKTECGNEGEELIVLNADSNDGRLLIRKFKESKTVVTNLGIFTTTNFSHAYSKLNYGG